MAPSNRAFTSDQVRRLRTLMGITQGQAAARFGVTLNTWSRWELGQISVHPARVPQLELLLSTLEEQRNTLDEQRRLREEERIAAAEEATGLLSVSLWNPLSQYRQAIGEFGSWERYVSRRIALGEPADLTDLKHCVRLQLSLLDAMHNRSTERGKPEDEAPYMVPLKAKHKEDLSLFVERYFAVIPDADPVWKAINHVRALLSWEWPEPPPGRRFRRRGWRLVHLNGDVV